MEHVFALGACRLVGPMSFLHRTGKLNFTNLGQHWYAHSAAEIKQRIEYMQNQRKIPMDVLSQMLDVDSCKTPIEDCDRAFTMPDVGIFEVSTRYGNWRGDYQLHTTLVAKQNITDREGRIASYEEMYDDLAFLAGIFKRVVLGCNIVYDADLRTPNPHRLKLNYALKALAQRDDRFTVVDPNDIINLEAPEKDLEDNNHFRPEFIPRLATLYETAVAG